jgi:hypothetical protein
VGGPHEVDRMTSLGGSGMVAADRIVPRNSIVPKNPLFISGIEEFLKRLYGIRYVFLKKLLNSPVVG